MMSTTDAVEWVQFLLCRAYVVASELDPTFQGTFKTFESFRFLGYEGQDDAVLNVGPTDDARGLDLLDLLNERDRFLRVALEHSR
jgi:hypothetical protein